MSLLRLYRLQSLPVTAIKHCWTCSRVPWRILGYAMHIHQAAMKPEKLTPQTDGRILHNCMLLRMSRKQAKELKKATRSRGDPQSSINESDFLPCAFLSMLKQDDSSAGQDAAPLEYPESSMFPLAGVSPVQFTGDGQPADEEPLPADTQLQLSVRERVRRLREQHVREQAAGDSGADMDDLWVLRYGQPDPSVAASETVCGGCGANFHCQQPSWPGYMPSEVMRAASEVELRDLLCQRCYFLRFHNAAVHVNVRPDHYQLMMRRMENRAALLVLVVDLLDFPCSIWPGMAGLVGRSRPVVVVGNKVDLLPQDSDGFLDRVTQSLTMALERCGVDRLNVKHTCLISARSGYGVEELITVLQTHWAAQGDVYLMGCTNVGKSTLFNTLLQSDLCRATAHDLIKRATTSRWPGTTLSLLKFPIHRVKEFHMHKRRYRLKQEQKWLQKEEDLRLSRLEETGNPKFAMLTGYIGRTFRGERARDGEATLLSSEPPEPPERLGGIAADDARFPTGRWVCDTPGFVASAQIIGHLTQEELLLTLTQRLLQPRTFTLYHGQSLFVAGLARVDYRAGPSMVRLTVFASADLPVTVTATEHADDVYRQYLHSGLFVVPCGGARRLARWPALEPSDVTVTGGSPTRSAADIVLSSAGWVAVTPCEDRSGDGETDIKFTAHTPGGVGVCVRAPAVLPYAVRLRGRRLRDSPAHQLGPLYQLSSGVKDKAERTPR